MTTKEFNRCLQLIKTGDKQRGMAELYNHYYKKLIFSAKLEGHSEANAEDIASNVLLSIFANAAHYQHIEKPNAYMLRAVKFATINFRKSNAKYAYTDLIDDIFPTKDNKPELKIAFDQFMEKLPKRQQGVVEVHFIYGLKIKDTAKFLNVSVSTVNRDIVLLKDDLKKFF